MTRDTFDHHAETLRGHNCNPHRRTNRLTSIPDPSWRIFGNGRRLPANSWWVKRAPSTRFAANVHGACTEHTSPGEHHATMEKAHGSAGRSSSSTTSDIADLVELYLRRDGFRVV